MIHDQWQQTLTEAPPADAGAGLAYLPELAVVRFQGSDVDRFLQGYLTCDTADLAPGQLTPTALCSLKGRVVMNGWCTPLPEEEAVLLILHASLSARLAEFLKAYLQFSRTRLEDMSTTTLVFGSLDTEVEGALVLDGRRGLFVTADPDRAGALWDTHRHVAAEVWHAALAEDGIPLVSAPVSERFLPQMLDLERLGAVDFEKGCYLGQEVVARAQHRGQVKRRLTRLRWQGAAAPAPGAEVTDEAGKSLGTILQSARTDADGGPALAVLSRDIPHVLLQGDVRLSPRT
jgi:folate-binding protein YgfZ